MPSSTLVYLAAPYTDPDPVLRKSRVELANIAAAKLMQEGLVVFSPITHGHSIADHLPPSVLCDHDFWMRQCLPMVERADLLVILPLYDWQHSAGIAKEIFHARKHNVKTFMWNGWLDGADAVLNYLKGDF